MITVSACWLYSAGGVGIIPTGRRSLISLLHDWATDNNDARLRTVFNEYSRRFLASD